MINTLQLMILISFQAHYLMKDQNKLNYQLKLMLLTLYLKTYFGDKRKSINKS